MTVPPYRPVLLAVLNAAVLLMFVVLMLSQRRKFGPVQVYWALLLLVVPSVYLLTSGSEPRYMVFMVCACVALLFTVELHVTDTLRRVLVLALAATLAASGYQALKLAKDVTSSWLDRQHDQQYMDVANVLRDNGLTKGYAQYWMAGITTYLTREDTLTIPMVCVDGQQMTYYWGMDAGWMAKPATRTFIAIDRDAQAAGLAVCKDAELTRQFGSPDSVLDVNGSIIIWVYDYDVTSRIPNSAQPPPW
jgi:hypothetical protein